MLIILKGLLPDRDTAFLLPVCSTCSIEMELHQTSKQFLAECRMTSPGGFKRQERYEN